MRKSWPKLSVWSSSLGKESFKFYEITIKIKVQLSTIENTIYEMTVVYGMEMPVTRQEVYDFITRHPDLIQYKWKKMLREKEIEGIESRALALFPELGD